MPVSSMLVVVLVAILVPSAGFTLGESPGSFVASAVGWAAYADAFAVPCTFGAMIVALPLTYGVGRLLDPARSRSAHVVATSSLAGTLAAVPLVTIGRPSDPDWWLGFTIFAAVSIAAGSAGAIACRRYRSISSRSVLSA
ncbi:hypothetical protein [Curtobacterium sp. RRHDQ10]|uniref:hypothetical protein n=1 Tax=Curtobacterium phyllosphaerae TaxID=3413379 RepID=UPI003BF1140B